LATLCGFIYGWKQRSENPPFIITRKTKEPPEVKLLKKGRYDEAAKAILDSIKDEKKDYFKYQSVAAVYGARAVKDPSNREKWTEQAAFYVGKSVSLAPNDSINLMGAALAIDRIGDISSQGCPYYEKARHYAQDAMNQLSDSIFAGDEKMPTQPIRDELGELLRRLQGKIENKCTNKP
jgi:tetratricopeptide (TPR) repeat protein